ncbi:MAG: hypothetical protein KatS3mg104_0069 [Phycisphaerae bacterium]|nr:MAG: hypothetical protein KatS3mg104_0069 [Phycisphaerae bacterium]
MLSRLLDPGYVEALDHLAISARRVVEGTTTGLHRSPIKGASVEFRQHRVYVPGDDPRRIDWRVLARSDRVFVKEYDEETNLKATLFLDASGSMGYGKPSKWEYAKRLLAGLSYLMLSQTESAGLVVASASRDVFLAPSSVPGQLSRIVDLLDQARPQGPTVLDQTILRVSDRMGKRSLVVVVSDFFIPPDRMRQGLARLNHDRHEIVLVRVLHPDEESFPFRSWLRFVGLEGEKARLVEGPLVRQTYLDRFKTHQRQLKELSARFRADLLTCRVDLPLIQAVQRLVYRSTLSDGQSKSGLSCGSSPHP